jgi:hypothetical protein
MGPPMMSHKSLEQNEAGPSTNGHSNGVSGHVASRNITRVELPGELMYEDDKEWAERHNDFDMDMASHTENGQAESSGHAQRHQHASTLRMPINREEVVRLILQGLRDIGYECVRRSPLRTCLR